MIEGGKGVVYDEKNWYVISALHEGVCMTSWPLYQATADQGDAIYTFIW